IVKIKFQNPYLRMQVGVLFLYKYKLCIKHVLLIKSFTWLVIGLSQSKEAGIKVLTAACNAVEFASR
ncbi:hypothetical protein, partial [Pseudomonas umsongensis]|uniref:hypothetical protein n=1 Tax=Pseudomonas umsongensis TaxID=198618 RepID=UPI001C4B5D8E